MLCKRLNGKCQLEYINESVKTCRNAVLESKWEISVKLARSRWSATPHRPSSHR